MFTFVVCIRTNINVYTLITHPPSVSNHDWRDDYFFKFKIFVIFKLKKCVRFFGRDLSDDFGRYDYVCSLGKTIQAILSTGRRSNLLIKVAIVPQFGLRLARVDGLIGGVSLK
jgi:hypothetical protein